MQIFITGILVCVAGIISYKFGYQEGFKRGTEIMEITYLNDLKEAKRNG